MLSSLIAFAGLALLLVAIPGPAVLLILKSALLRGRRVALCTALGVLCADLLWALASVAGLIAVLVSSQLAFEIVRYAGAAYLIYLGVRVLLSRTPFAEQPAGGQPVPVRPVEAGGWRAFREGLLCDLSNPKTVIVFASVIPQFLGANAHPAQALLYGVVFALLGFLALVCYALAFGAARGVLRGSRIKQAIVRTSGAVLAGLGIGLVVQRPVS